MELKPNCGSERAWVWSVSADYADGEAKPELLAARFASPAGELSLYIQYVAHCLSYVINIEEKCIAQLSYTVVIKKIRHCYQLLI
jgi:hypothetical protein